jgi:hypothetical protein
MSIRQVIAAFVIGLVGSVVIWVGSPYNSFILYNAFVSDDFMPVGAVGLMLGLVLVVNPLLHWLAPRYKLTFGQLALIFGIYLAASITPGQGGLRHILYPIGATPNYVASNQPLAKAYETLDPHPSLFPEPLGYDEDVPASDHFVDQLPEGEPVPWGKWRGPAIAWGSLLLPYWLMLTAIALIVLPHWRDTERQPFPLLEAQRALIENTHGGALPTVLTTRLFWVGFGAVFALHLLQGFNQYFPDSVPVIKLSFNLSSHFTEAPFRYLPGWIKWNQIHFLFLGIAYFMPNRVGLSICFFQFAYAIVLMMGVAYVPMFSGRIVFDHRLGAWVALPLCILWLGRRHWLSVMQSVFRRSTSDEDLRNKVGGIALLLGALGVMFWLIWAGVPWWWSIGLVFILFLFALGMTRIVAETGVPLMAPNTPFVTSLAKLMPVEWRTAAGMYFSGIVGIIAGHLNRVCATTMLCHCLGLDREATPRRHIRLAGLFFGVIVLGLIVGGIVQLFFTYTHAETLNQASHVMGRWGSGYFRWAAEGPLQQFLDGRPGGGSSSQVYHILFGAGLATFLFVMCQRRARWMIHPVALLFVGNWYAHRIWFSVMLGWGLKMLMLNLGGSRGYRYGRNLFLGLMIGEVAAVVCWALVAGLVAATGNEYQVVRILPF